MAGFMLLSCNTEVKEANYQIIPLPQEISVMDQAAPFILSNGTKIMYPEGNEKMQKNAEFLASYIKDLTGKSLAGTSPLILFLVRTFPLKSITRNNKVTSLSASSLSDIT